MEREGNKRNEKTRRDCMKEEKSATERRRKLAHDVKETGNYQNVCTEVD